MRIFIRSLLGFGLLLAALALSYIYTLYTPAQSNALSSSHYNFVETSLGGSGLLGASSANYQAAATSAILGVDTTSSSSFQIKAGNQTTNDPALSFAVNSPNVSFGTFSPTAATTATTTFQVSDYTSFGYVVEIFGTPPTQNSHTISAMSTTGTSQSGTEQFGINLVANTSPVNPLGANPDHGQFGFGSAATNYNTANNYRFVSGETIASAPKSSGITIYTISYILNVASITPAGQYVGNQTILCVGTY